MSPKALDYKANSVIYFKGDQGDKVFILKEGRIMLTSQDIETGQEVRDLIQTGEFFGVKSALGKYQRDESAIVVSDSKVIMFSVPEFEQLALSNTRIIMKMLKVFSNQLRRIHKQVQNLISKGEAEKPESGLYKIGLYYQKNNMVKQALYIYQRYLTYYPNGRFAQRATEALAQLEQYESNYGDSIDGPQLSMPSLDPDAHAEVAKGYYEAVSLFSQNRYQEALKAFKIIVADQRDSEHMAKSEYEIGRCYFMLEQYDNTVRHMSALITKYPKHPELKESLFYIGQSYQAKGDIQKALNFYNKILKMATEDEPVAIKVRKTMRKLERSE